MTKTYDITVLSSTDADITSQFLNRPSIDGWVPGATGTAENRGLTSLRSLTEQQAIIVLSQLIDQGHEWGSFDPQPLYDQIEAIVAVGRGAIVVPDGWTIKLDRVSDMDASHRRDNRDKNKADDLRRAIADYLADPPERSVLSSEEGVALEDIGAKLIKFSDHIVAVWN